MNRKNGFLLADALLAAAVGLLLFSSALMLTAQAAAAYRQARHCIGAASAGRSEMEALRREGRELFRQKEVSGVYGRYTVRSQAEGTDRQYIRYRVKVQDPDGSVHVFILLAKAEG